MLILSHVTGTFKDVVAEVDIPWNPDSEVINISTDSLAGSEEAVALSFFDKDGKRAGFVYIDFQTKIEYQLAGCTHWVAFPDTLPTETQRIWTITYNYAEQRIVYYCNGVELVNLVLSDDCTYTLWKNVWGRSEKPTRFRFTSLETNTAADGYRISSK